jgi:hypothetical protein
MGMDEERSEGDRAKLPGTAGIAGSEWPSKVAGTVEDVVAAVHDRVIRPLMIAARAVVYGTVAAAMILVFLALASIALIRILDVYVFGHRVWAADAAIGAVLVLGGAFAWSKRKPATAKEA